METNILWGEALLRFQIFAYQLIVWESDVCSALADNQFQQKLPNNRNHYNPPSCQTAYLNAGNDQFFR